MMLVMRMRRGRGVSGREAFSKDPEGALVCNFAPHKDSDVNVQLFWRRLA